ncbi:TonB family protein [Polynucleobacter sp. MWH-Spelu-300-X4]|uniref:energy transducer TonB n=1 Tax=Polynucleobacter sp. MWH-Spelu-300-X4 TaxID=2689109 RepID=UPI001BFE2B0A|nr:energy transducer TonB [Polynucleobacter sp. MWH-Spelu-300-X4]QWD80378.1 TonB family protein [Polynucleobacter sp. MWH-Spelu-300-X4]
MNTLIELFKKISAQQKIAAIVVFAHIFLLIGFQLGSSQHHSASTIGDTVTANLLDPNPQKEKSKNIPTPTPPTTLEKQKAPSPATTKQESPLAANTASSTPPPTSTGGSSSGDPKTVSISQAQCSVPEPVYPTLSRRIGEEGKAMVRLFINESGQVEKVSLAQSSGIQRLDQAALDAGQKARCKPFIEFGKPIKVTAIQPYIFRLE